jgi:phospholipase C
MSGRNIGDLLNARGVTWGWFQGGFTPTTPWNGQAGSYAKCDATTANIAGATPKDYSPHHSPFQYYKSTSNPHHLPPTSVKAIGHTDQANHQYDLTSFDAALKADNLPAVSFLKAPEAQDGHAGYSDPIDEQKFLVNEINAIQKSDSWSSTAVVVTYDDSDGWYDHVAPKIANGSNDPAVDSTVCTSVKHAAGGYADRCGPSQRLPLLVVSPWAAQNRVDHTPIEQTSVLRFIENNWLTGRIGDASFDTRAGSLGGLFDWRHPQQRQVLLDPSTGAVSAVVPTKPHWPAPPRGGWAAQP